MKTILVCRPIREGIGVVEWKDLRGDGPVPISHRDGGPGFESRVKAII